MAYAAGGVNMHYLIVDDFNGEGGGAPIPMSMETSREDAIEALKAWSGILDGYASDDAEADYVNSPYAGFTITWRYPSGERTGLYALQLDDIHSVLG